MDRQEVQRGIAKEMGGKMDSMERKQFLGTRNLEEGAML